MDKYLMKIGIDLDDAQLSKVTGSIVSHLEKVGKVSDDFIDNALETAKKYNAEIKKQEQTIAIINKRLAQGGVDPKTRAMLESMKSEAERVRDKYVKGSEQDGLESKAVVDATAELAEQMQTKGQKIGKVMSKGTELMGKFGAGISLATTIVGTFVNKVGDAIDKFANYSNQLNPLGAFGSQSQRNLMSRYGMTGTQALGFSNTLSAMGMSESDLGRMTERQRRVFNSLNQFWNEGIGKLDPAKLERYTETMEKYQEIQAKFQMGLQMQIMKLVANSPKFEKFMGKVENLMDATLDFLGSDLVQGVFDGLISFLTTVVTLLEKAMRLISIIPGFGGGGQSITNNNTTNNSNSTYNIYGTDFKSNDELARQISYSNKGGYKG